LVEVAREIGVPLKKGYNGDLPSRECGRIGGRMGGHLGGQIVHSLIARTEQDLVN